MGRAERLRSIRSDLWAYQLGYCYWCKQLVPHRCGTVDHIEPRSAGGSDSIDNLVMSCSKCNGERDSVGNPVDFIPSADRMRSAGKHGIR